MQPKAERGLEENDVAEAEWRGIGGPKRSDRTFGERGRHAMAGHANCGRAANLQRRANQAGRLGGVDVAVFDG